MKDVMKKFVNASEGSVIYSLGKTRFMTLAKEAGANIFVAGTAIVNSENMEATIETMRNQRERIIMLELEGEIETIIYCNETNSYTVAVMNTEDESITIVGFLPFVNIGDSLKVTRRICNT